MAKLLFKLNGVPDDEAQAVRALLTEAGIPFYETEAGNWGISLAAIWLRDDERLDEAKNLLDTYQQERHEDARERAREAPPEAFWQRLWRQPLQVLAMLALVVAILYISIVPFLSAWD